MERPPDHSRATLPVELVGLRAGLGINLDNGAKGRTGLIHLVDPLEVGVDHLARGPFTRRHRCAERRHSKFLEREVASLDLHCGLRRRGTAGERPHPGHGAGGGRGPEERPPGDAGRRMTKGWVRN